MMTDLRSNVSHSPLTGYLITGLCSSVFFYILGSLTTIAIQWCQKRCYKYTDTSYMKKGQQASHIDLKRGDLTTATSDMQTVVEMNTNVAYANIK